MSLKPPTYHRPKGFTSVLQVNYLFRARNNESSGWQFGLVVNVTSPSCKGQEFNCSNSCTFWQKTSVGK